MMKIKTKLKLKNKSKQKSHWSPVTELNSAHPLYRLWNVIQSTPQSHQIEPIPAHIKINRNAKDEDRRGEMSLVVLCRCLQKAIEHRRHLADTFSASSFLQPINVRLPQLVWTEFQSSISQCSLKQPEVYRYRNNRKQLQI